MTENFNPCKARECNACCQNTVLSMTLAELGVFSRKYIEETGKVPERLTRKLYIEEQKQLSANEYLTITLWYSATKTLESYLETGKHGSKEALVFIEGICSNNKNGECTIYEERPQCCKNFEFKSDEHKNSLCFKCRLGISTDPRFIPVNEIGMGRPTA